MMANKKPKKLFESFNFDDFLDKKHYFDKNKYLEKVAIPLGKGTSRRTFEIPNKGLVIKIAFPTEIIKYPISTKFGKQYYVPHIIGGKLGHIQNKEEHTAFKKCNELNKMGILTTIYIHEDEASKEGPEWLLSEAVIPLANVNFVNITTGGKVLPRSKYTINKQALKEFEHCTGFDFEHFKGSLINVYNILRSFLNNDFDILDTISNKLYNKYPKTCNSKATIKPPFMATNEIKNEDDLLEYLLDEAEGNTFAVKVALGAIKCKLNINDLAAITSWGISKVDGKPKLLDYGFSEKSENIYNKLPAFQKPNNEKEIKELFIDVYFDYIFPYILKALELKNNNLYNHYVKLFNEFKETWELNHFSNTELEKKLALYLYIKGYGNIASIALLKK